MLMPGAADGATGTARVPMMKRLSAASNIRRLAGITAVTVLGPVVAWFMLVPATDGLARHDVGRVKGSLHETAVDNARGRLLTLGAGLFAAGALVFTARTFYLSREGQVTDRYAKAVEQLGSDKADVRIGGIYALERIARDSARDHPTVMEVLTAFIREHSKEHKLPEGNPASKKMERAMRPDVQAALTVVGRRNPGRDIRSIDLSGADLRGADLSDADLSSASLGGADLSRAILTDASLRSANLSFADLTHAIMVRTDLAHAKLVRVNLSGANLGAAGAGRAELKGANLTKATLSGADLTRSDLTGARLDGAGLAPRTLMVRDACGGVTRVEAPRAILTGATLVRASLVNADLASADLTDADLTGAILTGAKLTAAKLTRTNLTDANLADATLSETDLSTANLTGADLNRAR